MISGGDLVDGCVAQNMMNTCSEVQYYLNVNIMVIFEYHSNIIAAALGLENLPPSKKSE